MVTPKEQRYSYINKYILQSNCKDLASVREVIMNSLEDDNVSIEEEMLTELNSYLKSKNLKDKDNTVNLEREFI